MSLKDALEQEITWISENKHKKPFVLYHGKLLFTLTSNDDPAGYYRFDNSGFLNLTPETGVLAKIQGTTYRGEVQFCDRNSIEFVIEDCLDWTINEMEVEIDSTHLLELLVGHIVNLKPSKLVAMLQKEHANPEKEIDAIPLGQDNAIDKAIKDPISIIWGPPGTGKTYTLAQIAIKLMEKGKRVLIVSQSNMAVDTAILQIKNVLVTSGVEEYEGKVIRYGMSRSPELMKDNKELLSWDLAFMQMPDLKERYDQLSEEINRKRSNDDNKDFEPLLQERNKITALIGEREKEILNKSLIVATTATKATINKSFEENKWDVVIFDEVSMAYVPQIIVAASLAEEKLVLLGDFRQLSPIVTCPANTELKKDIFSYLHVTDLSGNVRKHHWLSMLNKQWRMHPEIASFVNERNYKELFTAPEIIDSRKRMVELSPFCGKAINFVDYAGLQAISMYSSSGSKFNIFSAILSLNIAIIAEESGNGVGIITPYAAQSSLINAMLKDLKFKEGRERNIYCSTVHQFQGSEKDVIIFDTVESSSKKDMGKMLAQSDNDESMRLVNVALTRTRAKFILIGNSQYLAGQMNLSEDVKALIARAREVNHVEYEEIMRSYLSSLELAKVYLSEISAIEQFNDDVSQASKSIEFLHIAQNREVKSSSFSFEQFGNLLEILHCPEKHVYATSKACNKLPKNLQDRLMLISSPPDDDFVIIDSKLFWSNVPAVTNNIDDCTRPFYSIKGQLTVSLFKKLIDLQKSLKSAEKRSFEEVINSGEFCNYLKSLNCHCMDFNCLGKPMIKIAKSGNPYLVCSKCGKTIETYIDKDIFSDYLLENKVKCKECGAYVKMSKNIRPYCVSDYKHKVGFDLNDVLSKPIKGLKQNK